MSLAAQRKQQQRNGNRTFFKDGIRNTKLSQQKTTSVFRVMPSFDPANPDPSTSYLPSVNIDGEVTDFARFVYVSVFMGHGMQKKDIVSPKTFDPEAPCPLEDMWTAIYNDKTTWQYLVKDDDARGTKKCFTRPNPQLIINAIDRAQIQLGVVLGLLSNSAGNALLDLACARTTNAQVQAMIAANPEQYLLGFANGDITDPNGGTMLTCGIPAGAKNGDFSGYVVAPLTVTNPMTKQQETQSMPLSYELMASRYDLSKIEELIESRSYEDIVTDLVGLYNKRSPINGYHEYYLLRTAFPDYTELIPEPPPAPASSNTVNIGWEAETPSFTPPQGGFGPGQAAPNPDFQRPSFQTKPGGFTPPPTFQPKPPQGGFGPQPRFSKTEETTPTAESAKPAKKSSEKRKLAEIAASQPIADAAGQASAPLAPGDAVPPYTAGKGSDLSKMLNSIKNNAAGQ